MVSENPMADEKFGHRVFVIHTRGPLIIAQAHHIPVGEPYELPLTGAKTQHEDEEIVLSPVQVIFEESKQVSYEKIMRRMADWYKAYLEWEDSRLDNME